MNPGGNILCCEAPEFKSVGDLLYLVKEELVFLGKKVLENLWYGYRETGESKIRKLRVYHDVLEQAYAALHKGGSLCLSCDEFHYISEGAKKLIRRSCSGYVEKGLDVDDSGRAMWSASNPTCIAYEEWEASMYAICEKLEFEITRTNKHEVCNLVFAIIKKDIVCDIFVEIAKIAKDCKIKYEVMSSLQDCEIKYKGMISKKKCEISYRQLLKETSCSIGFNDYVNIINCGVSTELVRSVYDCGLSVQYSVTDNCPIIVTASNESFTFENFNVKNVDGIWQKLKDMNIV